MQFDFLNREYQHKVLDDISLIKEKWNNVFPTTFPSSKDMSTVFFNFPYLFRSAFSKIEEKDLQRFTSASLLYSFSILLIDNAVGGKIKNQTLTANYGQVVASHFETYRILHEIFDESSIFWDRFQKYVHDYIWAVSEEQKFTSEVMRKSEFTEEIATAITQGKNGIARTVVAGMVELGKGEHLYTPLSNSVKHFYVARQIVDDLNDWRQDLKLNAPSMLFSYIYSDTQKFDLSEKDLMRKIYINGYGIRILHIAVSEIELAKNSVADINVPVWKIVLDKMQKECTLLIEKLNRLKQ